MHRKDRLFLHWGRLFSSSRVEVLRGFCFVGFPGRLTAASRAGVQSAGLAPAAVDGPGRLRLGKLGPAVPGAGRCRPAGRQPSTKTPMISNESCDSGPEIPAGLTGDHGYFQAVAAGGTASWMDRALENRGAAGGGRSRSSGSGSSGSERARRRSSVASVGSSRVSARPMSRAGPVDDLPCGKNAPRKPTSHNFSPLHRLFFATHVEIYFPASDRPLPSRGLS